MKELAMAMMFFVLELLAFVNLQIQKSRDASWPFRAVIGRALAARFKELTDLYLSPSCSAMLSDVFSLRMLF
jgi:hypothetical protein